MPLSFRINSDKPAPLSRPQILKSVFTDDDESVPRELTSQPGSKAHWIEKKRKERKDDGPAYPDAEIFYKLYCNFPKRRNSGKGFDGSREESSRQNDNYLKVVLWNAYEKNVLPSISEDQSKAMNVILFLAKLNIKDKFSIDDIEKEAIKNIQSSFYILNHEGEDQIRFARRYLLETLFNPGALLKDDYSLDENKLAIVGRDGSNFADFLLNSSNMGFPIFQQFLSNKKFSSNPNDDKRFKQKLLESMIYLTPLTREVYNPELTIRDNCHAYENFYNSLTLIPNENKKNFIFNAYKNFALRSAKIKNSSYYIDLVISSIMKYNSEGYWAEIIEDFFSHPSKEENPIKSAFICDNDIYLLKVKEFIDKTFEEKTQEKQNFIKKLAKNCGFDDSVLEKKFESLEDKRVSPVTAKPQIFQASHPLSR
jgi:hypothetical protein